MNNTFDDIRPYCDNEIHDAMQRIVQNPLFPKLASFTFPDKTVEDVSELVSSVDNIRDFQLKIMYQANSRIIEESISSFEYSGIENVDPTMQYLFVSNHRDIVLDASLLQAVLIDNDIDTTEITFGANLMQGDLIVDIGKSNKMFRVERPGGSIREFYKASKHLSDYIRTTISDKKQSVWIAQRNGRTKDGIDRTDQGIINMFRMSSDADRLSAIAELNIMPVSVSYEWEPCDMLKVMELYITTHHSGTYVKKKGEDLNSILTGILQPKGKVHFNICKPIQMEDLLPFADLSSSEFNRQVASLIDQRICSGYALMPNNYIAYDLLHDKDQYAAYYTEEQKNTFLKHASALDEYSDTCDVDELKKILLGIYANPVDSKITYAKS